MTWSDCTMNFAGLALVAYVVLRLTCISMWSPAFRIVSRVLEMAAIPLANGRAACVPARHQFQ